MTRRLDASSNATSRSTQAASTCSDLLHFDRSICINPYPNLTIPTPIPTRIHIAMSQPTSTTPLLTAHPNLSEFTERDLKDILTDPTLTRAVLSSLEPVRTAMDEQAKLSRGNEDLARQYTWLVDVGRSKGCTDLRLATA
jgi:hypothetical protein